MQVFGLLALLFLLKPSFAHNTNQSSQEILQSNAQGTRDSPGAKKSPERCDSEPGKTVENQFKDYVRKFANTESGKVLKDIIGGDAAAKLSAPISKFIGKGHINKLNQVGKEPRDNTWNVVNFFVVAIHALVLGVLTCLWPLSTYTVLAITAYVLGGLVMGLCHDLVPLWVVAVFSVFGDLLVSFLLSLVDDVKRRIICVFSICMVFAKMVYDVHAVVPLEFISPSYTGVSGIITKYIFRSNSFVFVRLLYLMFLVFIAASLFMKLPSFVAGEPMEIQEIDAGAIIMKKLICFVTGLPAAGFVVQVYCWVRKESNPLGPFTYFAVPTRFRVDTLQSPMAVILWVVFSMVYYQTIKHLNENRLLTPPKKRRSWRTYTRTISRL